MAEQQKKQAKLHPVYTFAEFTLDTGRGSLSKAGNELILRPQSFSVLRYLVERPRLLVSREEILQAVWAGAAVTDDSLTQCITEIRRVLDDTGRTLIKTVPKRGFMLDIPVARLDSTAPPPQRKNYRIQMAGTLAAAVVVAVIAIWMNWQAEPPTTAPPAEPARKSIAVLPLDDMSQEQDMQYVGDGIAEEILNQLMRYPDLRVIARTSSFAFKGKGDEIAEIRRQLNVDYVLEGSVRRSDDDTRITLQLIDTKTHAHLWSSTFDPALFAENLINVQNMIAEEVAQKIGVSIGSKPAAGAALPMPKNPAAVDLYLKGQYYLRQIETGASLDFDAAIAEFQATIAADPAWAPGHAALGRVLHFKASNKGWGDRDLELYSESQRHLERAIELQPDYAPAYASLAYITRHHHLDFAEAERLYQKVFALGGQDHWGYALYMSAIGQHAKANDYFERALLADPLSGSIKGQYAWSLICAGRFEESLEHWSELTDRYGQSREFDVTSVFALLKSGRLKEGRKLYESIADDENTGMRDGAVLAMLGMTDEAEAVLDALDAAPNFRVLHYTVNALTLGQRDRALTYIEKAAADDPHWLTNLQCESATGELWDEPRFRAVFREAGFPGW